METTLEDLLERNRRHVESLDDGHFDDVQDGQAPALVSVCCSDSRVSQAGMWDVDEAGFLFTVGNIGNQVWDTRDGERVVNGDVLYPLLYAGTDVAAVVGHTGCGAVTATLEAHRGEAGDFPPGVQERVDALRPVIEAGLDDDRIDPDREVGRVNQLVEYNVDRQVSFLRASDEVTDKTVLGFVYDFQEVYGNVRGRCYLVNVDGETDESRLREAVPAEYEAHARRLL
jgi:carbonic anhydrase